MLICATGAHDRLQPVDATAFFIDANSFSALCCHFPTENKGIVMKKSLTVIALAFLLSGYAFADSAPSSHTTQELQTPAAVPVEAEGDLESHGHYINKDGKTVHAPSKSKSGAVPDGASAQCRDGSYSFSQHRRGTCSHHGGVMHWF